MLSERQISHVYVSAYLAGQLHDYNHIRYLLYLDLCTIIASSWSILFLMKLYFLFSWREESSRDICMYLYRQIWVTRLPLAERKFQFVWLFILLFFSSFFFGAFSLIKKVVVTEDSHLALGIHAAMLTVGFSYIQLHNPSSTYFVIFCLSDFQLGMVLPPWVIFGNWWGCFWLLTTEYYYWKVENECQKGEKSVLCEAVSNVKQWYSNQLMVVARIYCGEKTISLKSGAGKTGQSLVKEWN